jgi:hypothetical protein
MEYYKTCGRIKEKAEVASIFGGFQTTTRHKSVRIIEIEQITANNMRGMWKCILPHCAITSDFKEETGIKEIANIGGELGFDGLENDSVQGLLNSHVEE